MTTKRKQLFCVLLLGCILFFGWNDLLAITDPVESNYTETASEMLATKEYLSPLIYGNYWFDKPIFFYWELIAAFKMFGVNEFAARFFPALLGIIGLFMIYHFASRIFDQRTGFFSALILGTSLEYWLLSKAVITDSTLFIFFNAILVCFFLGYTNRDKGYYYYGCYFFSALSVLTKGPIGLLLPGLIIITFLALQRDLGQLKNMKLFTGSLIFIIIGGSWYYFMYQLHGSAFLDGFIGVHNVLRATVSEHPRWNVWYYYLGIFFIGFFPWCFTLPLVIHKYIRLHSRPVIDTTTLFLLLWAIIVNVFFQCMATKYTTYTFPALFPLSILAARLLRSREKLLKGLVCTSAILYTTLTYFVAVPICQTYSGKNIASSLQDHIKQQDLVISYGKYKTSLVFYTNHLIYNLKSQQDIEADKPRAMSWKSKNVMPFLAFEEMPTDKNIFLVIDKNNSDSFPKQLSRMNWLLLGETTTAHIYYRPAS